MKKVVITYIPLRYYFYYQWLILGLYELEKEKQIILKFKLKSPVAIFLIHNYKAYLGLRKYLGLFKKKSSDNDYLLKGYVEEDKKRHKFVFDIADTPYYFDDKVLKDDMVYFKAQCPKIIHEHGFDLSEGIIIPYHPEVIKNKHKIHAAMMAPGMWSYNMYSYKSLLAGYKNLFLKNVEKTKILMCYFGGNKGPKPFFSYKPDLYLNESHLLGFYKNIINHPNEKRAIASRIISELGDNYDGRIIKVFNADGDLEINNKNLFIPLSEYTRHISQFSYNFNISGFRKSIPNRFVYSFCVGTAIVTDKLGVKWYQPFEDEVIELDEMGYLPNHLIDWSSFEKKIKDLPDVNREKILEIYEKKWSPKSFAKYVVETCISTKLP